VASVRYLAGVIERQSTDGNETVQVRMMPQVLRTGVQHGEHTMRAPRWRGSAAISSNVSEARNNRL